MESEARTALLVDEELLEIPSNIVNSNRIVHKFVCLSDLQNSLWAGVLNGFYSIGN